MERNENTVTAEPTRINLMEMDIDFRAMELLMEIEGQFEDEQDRDLAIKLIRAAYGLGYHHALTEPVIASLHIDNGYKPPVREKI